MVGPPRRPHWVQLGAELRTLRSLAGLTTREIAPHTGLSSARVSRVETGQSILSLPEIDAWVEAVGADATAHERLRELAMLAHGHAVDPFRLAASDLQERIADVEARAGRIVTVQPQIVPGLLQTAGYARAILTLVDVTGQDLAAAVAARMRRQEALYDPATQFEFLLTEAALRWPAGGPEIMAAQYDRLTQVSTLNNVRIGLIPLGQPVHAVPWCDVNIYDEFADGTAPMADIELPHAEVWVTDPTDVDVYLTLVRRLWDSAVTGREALDLLAGLAGPPTDERQER